MPQQIRKTENDLDTRVDQRRSAMLRKTVTKKRQLIQSGKSEIKVLSI
jgi:hypothetical protein